MESRGRGEGAQKATFVWHPWSVPCWLGDDDKYVGFFVSSRRKRPAYRTRGPALPSSVFVFYFGLARAVFIGACAHVSHFAHVAVPVFLLFSSGCFRRLLEPVCGNLRPVCGGSFRRIVEIVAPREFILCFVISLSSVFVTPPRQ